MPGVDIGVVASVRQSAQRRRAPPGELPGAGLLASDDDVRRTGLGLAISRRFSVESEYGRGSTFTVRLPIEVGLPSAERDA
jgi:hypothetical protein